MTTLTQQVILVCVLVLVAELVGTYGLAFVFALSLGLWMIDRISTSHRRDARIDVERRKA